MIAVASILFGYACLIAAAGWLGLAIGVVHVGVMLAATWRRRVGTIARKPAPIRG